MLVEAQGTVSSVRTLGSRDEMVQAIYEYFAIPKEFTIEAIREIGELWDAWN
jgi:hypothetical protein